MERRNAGIFLDVSHGRAAMTEHAVVIAGWGPAGMMLAAELALAKVDVAVVERRADHVLVGSRAGGFHSRTDGYVAWVGDRTRLGLPEALATWFGPPAAA
jgi:choline dehydrogenase-like flavoprotein